MAWSESSRRHDAAPPANGTRHDLGGTPLLPPEDARPHVVIVGGFMTMPPNYWPLRRRLLARGAASVAIAPIGFGDWIAAGFVGFGPLLTAAARTITDAHRRAGSTPILVVGHSAGGIVARLALSPTPYRGRSGIDPATVGALVTLGTPHGLGSMRVRIPHAGHHATRFLDRVAPGAHHFGTTAYLTVGSRALVRGRASRRPWERVVELGYGMLLGSVPDDVGEASPGDGIVPVAAVHLEGAEQLTFDDVKHGHIGGPWYGDERVIDRWWPVAVDVWRASAAARGAAPSDPFAETARGS
jgi:hypothetical protein